MTEIFSRFENKYLLTDEKFRTVKDALAEHMDIDGYNEDGSFYSIKNLYLDTPDSFLIRTSLQKPIYKEKLRLRGYGEPQADDLVFLEIKKKYKGLVSKRRTALTLAEAERYIKTGLKPAPSAHINSQILNEIDYMMRSLALAPALFLSYNRMAFFDREDTDLRVTFDKNIRTRRTGLRLASSPEDKALLEEGVYLMEIKTANGIPIWLTQLLSKKGIYSASFSKYGTEYQQLLEYNYHKGENVRCSSQSSPLKPTHLYTLTPRS